MGDPMDRLVARVLTEPALVEAVQSLAPPQLRALVRRVGIADAGELLAIATPRQFVDLVDDELWRQHGAHEVFDHRQFPIWLEVMGEHGDALVVQRLRDLPEETLILALFGQLFVLDADVLGMSAAAQSAEEAADAERILDEVLYLELDRYTLVSRRGVGWDAVIAAVLALDAADHALVERVLEACCAASMAYIEDNGGLYDVLVGEDALTEDAHGERHQRRSAAGYVDPADAIAFLRLIERHDPVALPKERDPVSHAYFRELVPEPALPTPIDPTPLAELLAELGIGPTAALPPADSSGLRAAIGRLSPEVAAQRHRELAYLANVLVASGRNYTPSSAVAAVVEACGGALAKLTEDGTDPVTVLTETSCDRLFRYGWSRPSA